MAYSHYNYQQVYKGSRQQKENVIPANPQNFSSLISDEEALKIHGLNFESNDHATDSDSGKSSFDEEYFKNKPQPLRINRRNTVTIKRLNAKNEQPQKEGYVHNTEVKKDSSNLTSATSKSRSSSKKNSNKPHFQPFQHVPIVNPYIHPNLNKFAVRENGLQNLRDISQSSTTNHFTPKCTSTTSTNIKEDFFIDKSYLPVPNKTVVHHANFQKETLSDYRNIRAGEIASTSQIYTESRSKENKLANVHNIPQTSGRTRNATNLTPTPTSTQHTLPNYNRPALTLNAAALPNVITRVPDSSSRGSPRNSLQSRSVTNNTPSRNVQASSNRNSNLSAHRELLARDSRGTPEGTSGNTSDNAGLCDETSDNFISRWIDFIFCRKC